MIETLKRRAQVIAALMLRDMRTRFGSSHLGYIIQILWPLTHLVAITLIFSFLRRTTPIFGAENSVYIATGVLPYILMIYPSRMTSYAIDTGRQTLVFPIVKPLDIILARAFVEILTAFVVVILYIQWSLLYGIEVLPENYEMAAEAILATVYLSTALGIVGNVFLALSNFWGTLLAIMMIFAYLLSGIFFPMASLKPETQAILWWNPVAHCVEWLRASYYIGYGQEFVSKAYVFWTATVLLFLGLLGEKFLRGKLIAG
ncbi:capsular polysaccharide transport system permease protein [Rhodobacter sp. JA431]|uniref:ABC transporter permease n=1 Tax=Rhodobacter sp. JA431 TaxID=570013 RepID=UPI000BCC8E97|nr:ABC transporter permease [Rhodobacter sp. JA431]SOC08252.1 capsular polysaccharide transport system permease protein [Rhodobacter sp. JA431]